MGRRKNTRNKVKLIELIILVIFAVILELTLNNINAENTETNDNIPVSTVSFDISSVPQYSDEPYVAIDNNIPSFSEEDHSTKAFENYSELDSLGRCGVAYANICKEIMPVEGEQNKP